MVAYTLMFILLVCAQIGDWGTASKLFVHCAEPLRAARLACKGRAEGWYDALAEIARRVHVLLDTYFRDQLCRSLEFEPRCCIVFAGLFGNLLLFYVI